MLRCTRMGARQQMLKARTAMMNATLSSNEAAAEPHARRPFHRSARRPQVCDGLLFDRGVASSGADAVMDIVKIARKP